VDRDDLILISVDDHVMIWDPEATAKEIYRVAGNAREGAIAFGEKRAPVWTGA
jgi:hypothetical protein